MSDESKTQTFDLAAMAIMTALVIVTTSFSVPFTPTAGYFNLGDIIVVTTALLFGPLIGGFVGGVGSALADIWLGYAAFAPLTLVVKGVEGYVVGYIAGPQKDPSRNLIILSWVIGGLIIIAGYWLGEVFIMGYGMPAATAEALSINSLQAIVSGVGIPLSSAIKKRLNI